MEGRRAAAPRGEVVAGLLMEVVGLLVEVVEPVGLLCRCKNEMEKIDAKIRCKN